MSWIRRHLVAPCDPSSTLLVSIVAPTSGHAPLHGQFTPLPNKKSVAQSEHKNDGTSIALFHTNTHYNIYTAHMKQPKKNSSNSGGDNGHQSKWLRPCVSATAPNVKKK